MRYCLVKKTDELKTEGDCTGYSWQNQVQNWTFYWNESIKFLYPLNIDAERIESTKQVSYEYTTYSQPSSNHGGRQEPDAWEMLKHWTYLQIKMNRISCLFITYNCIVKLLQLNSFNATYSKNLMTITCGKTSEDIITS